MSARRNPDIRFRRREWRFLTLNGLSGWCASRFAEAVGHDAKCIDCASPSVRPDEMAADLMLKTSPGGFAAGLSDDRSSVALATSFLTQQRDCADAPAAARNLL